MAPEYGLVAHDRYFGRSIALRLPFRFEIGCAYPRPLSGRRAPERYTVFLEGGRRFSLSAMAVRPRRCVPSAMFGWCFRREAAAI